MASNQFRSRQLGYDLRESLLFRPALWLLGFVALALILPHLERTGVLDGRAFRMEPGTAQVVLGTIASASMSVVSVVYSILLVALSLASMQFSTRILAGFMRDRVNQNTLGYFVGTFTYSLMVLRSVRTEPPWVPGIAVFGALGLAVGSLGALVYFIHHIVRSIQANHLVDRIAKETEGVIDTVYAERLDPGEEPAHHSPSAPPAGAVLLHARRSGYVQILDHNALHALVRPGVALHLTRGMGQFVAEGAPLAWVSPPSAATPAFATALDGAIDLGPQRTMQDDAEFGFRQIVDIALKAVSPAVNDPSTAATCVDHLGRLLIRVSNRRTPPECRRVGDGALYIPNASFVDLVELSVDQLRQYTRGDMAVTLRIVRMLGDVASVTLHETGRQAIRVQLEMMAQTVSPGFVATEREELVRRLGSARTACGER